MWFKQNMIVVGYGPLTVTVTTRIITFFVGDPYKLSFTTVTVRGPYQIVDVEYFQQQHEWLMVWLISFASLFFMFCMESNLITMHMTCMHSSIKGLGKCLTPHPPPTKLLAFIQEIDLWEHAYVLTNLKKSMPVVQHLCSFVSNYVSLCIHWDALPRSNSNTHHQHYYIFSRGSLLTSNWSAYSLVLFEFMVL